MTRIWLQQRLMSLLLPSETYCLKRGAEDSKIPRYKLFVQAVIGELKGQVIKIISQCLWDDKLDNYADYTFQRVNSSLNYDNYFCTVMVWGCYNEYYL